MSYQLSALSGRQSALNLGRSTLDLRRAEGGARSVFGFLPSTLDFRRAKGGAQSACSLLAAGKFTLCSSLGD